MNSDPDHPDDFELMRRVRAGDQSAFAALVRRHQAALVNFFRRMGVINDAEDLAQDTFVRLFRYRTRYRPTARLTTFLYRMAAQVHLDHVRKIKRRKELQLPADDAPGGLPAPDGRAEDLAAAVARLPEPMRQVLVMRVFQGLDNARIAEVLDIPVGTVKSRMFNALRALRALLEGYDGTP